MEPSVMTINIRARKGLDKYPAKAHARRVAEQLGGQHGHIILIATRSKMYSHSDQAVPFRQDRYFYFLSGCNEPDCYLEYNTKKDKLTLWLPPINSARVVWTGRGSTVDEALEKYDIDEAKYIPKKSAKSARHSDAHSLDFPVALGKEKQHHPMGKIPNPPAYGIPIRVADSPENSTVWCLDDRLFAFLSLSVPAMGLSPDSTKIDNVSLREAMDICRLVKDEFEIELIRQANDITSAAHTNVLQNLHKFRNEAQVEAAYMQTCIAQRAKEQAYSPIAGSGSNAAVLHYDTNDADFGKAQTLVLDAGCEVSCYASDVTRTMPLNSDRPGYWPSKEAEEIYNLVERVQESCINQMRPGKRFIEVDWHARHMIIEGLIDLGILRGKAKEIIYAGTSSAFFPHGLGHSVGLEVHDVSPTLPPRKPSKPEDCGKDTAFCALKEAYLSAYPDTDPRCLQKLKHMGINSNSPMPSINFSAQGLQPGMIFTIEPGIYFNSFLLENYFLNNPRHQKYIDEEVLKRYMHVGGVRIEDDILITRNGFENITTAPKGEKMLELIREAAKTK